MASPLEFLTGSSGPGPLWGWGEPVSPRPARPVTPERERQGVLRPLRRRLRPSPSLARPSCSLHGCRPPLWAVLPLWRAVPSLGCAQPWAGGRDVGQSRPRCRGCSRQLPAPFRGFPSRRGLPSGTPRGGSMVPVGLAEAGATERDGDQAEPFRATCPGRAAGHRGPAPRGPPGSVSPSGRSSRVWAALVPVSGPLCVCTCDSNLVAQTQRRLSVCTHRAWVCAACVF